MRTHVCPALMWKSEHNFGELLWGFNYVSARDCTRVIRHVDKYLQPLSHLTGSVSFAIHATLYYEVKG